MAATNSVEDSHFFQSRRAAGEAVAKEPPKFDLESYIQNYEGRTRLERLIHIGSTSTVLAIEALKAAVREAQQGQNTVLYATAVHVLSQIAPDEPLAQVDEAWIERKQKGAKIESDRLEAELKSYRNNLIKESIRMGNEDLGRHYYHIGQLADSWSSYHRMRDYCTTPRHIADMTFHLILVSIQQQSWQSAQSQLQKVDSQQLKQDEREEHQPTIRALQGLCYMQLGNFKEAAQSFLNTKFAYCKIDRSKQGHIAWQKEILTPNDVAVYGGLCALGSMTRQELQRQVLENSEFRQYLELEPHIRRAISLFCSSKYSACLDVLEGYRPDYLLDIYLSSWLNDLYSKVRSKSIVQYFIPYSCVTLEEMAKAFPSSAGGADIETELAQMIGSGALNARIDLVEGLLLAPKPNPRHVVHEQAIKASADYTNTLRLRLLRLNILNAGLDIKAKSHGQLSAGFESLMNEDDAESLTVGGNRAFGGRGLGKRSLLG